MAGVGIFSGVPPPSAEEELMNRTRDTNWGFVPPSGDLVRVPLKER
jgi:hypothetical protein